MKFPLTLKIMAAAATLSLAGCYIVPIENTRGPAAQPASAAPHPVTVADFVLNARLYPSNTAAQNLGAGTATVTVTANGQGAFRAQIGNETFVGDATRTPGSRSGKANGAGSLGRYVSCDYTMNSDTVGSGSCTTSTGASFNMHISR